MKRKKAAAGILALSLMAIIGVGGTLAYLSSVTDTKTNIFTIGKGIEGELTEPDWREEYAQDFVPGRIIAKNPLIKNISQQGADDAWVAAKISYQIADGINEDGSTKWKDCTYEELDCFINIRTGNEAGFNSSEWVLEDNNTTAYYKEALAAQTETSAIFDKVEIDPLALTAEQIASRAGENCQFDITKYEVMDSNGNVVAYTYETYEMSDFKIEVTGYMAQEEGFADAKEAMQAAFPDLF